MNNVHTYSSIAVVLSPNVTQFYIAFVQYIDYGGDYWSRLLLSDHTQIISHMYNAELRKWFLIILLHIHYIQNNKGNHAHIKGTNALILSHNITPVYIAFAPVVELHGPL